MLICTNTLAAEELVFVWIAFIQAYLAPCCPHFRSLSLVVVDTIFHGLKPLLSHVVVRQSLLASDAC